MFSYDQCIVTSGKIQIDITILPPPYKRYCPVSPQSNATSPQIRRLGLLFLPTQKLTNTFFFHCFFVTPFFVDKFKTALLRTQISLGYRHKVSNFCEKSLRTKYKPSFPSIPHKSHPWKTVTTKVYHNATLRTQIVRWFQAQSFQFMLGISKLNRLCDGISAIYHHPLPGKRVPQIWMYYGFSLKKLGLKQQNFEISTGTTDAKRLWVRFTF